MAWVMTLAWAMSLAAPTLAHAGTGALASAPDTITIRVLHLNIFGRRENNCVERFREIARRIITANPPYDIISLNEDWDISDDPHFSCGASALWQQLDKVRSFRNTATIVHSLRHQPRAQDFLEAGGGNSLLTPHRIIDAHANRYVNSGNIPISGYLLSRVELRPGVELDVWTTHLEARSDDCDRDCRAEQLSDFGMVSSTLSGVPDDGRTSTNPVLILGDFNIGGPMRMGSKSYAGNPGYEDIVESLKSPRDLWLETHAFGDPWFGSGYTLDCKLNGLLASDPDCDYRDRIDYMFVPTHKDYGKPTYRIKAKSVNVTRWKTQSGLDVSDHFGLDATLELSKN